jgi:hypothetical protein
MNPGCFDFEVRFSLFRSEKDKREVQSKSVRSKILQLPELLFSREKN